MQRPWGGHECSKFQKDRDGHCSRLQAVRGHGRMRVEGLRGGQRAQGPAGKSLDVHLCAVRSNWWGGKQRGHDTISVLSRWQWLDTRGQSILGRAYMPEGFAKRRGHLLAIVSKADLRLSYLPLSFVQPTNIYCTVSLRQAGH